MFVSKSIGRFALFFTARILFCVHGRRLFGAVLALVAVLQTPISYAAYKDDCSAANVPNPPAWGDPNWTSNGKVNKPFISQNLNARVYFYKSTSPVGVCVALPRDDGTNILLLGVICLGGDISNATDGKAKACFWDNQDVTKGGASFPIKLGTGISIVDQFAGGPSLTGTPGAADGGNVCTDCHAGENPFVINPAEGAFANIPNEMSNNWYQPVNVPMGWPLNPGPTDLSGVKVGMGQNRCTSCHVRESAGGDGRFPAVSKATTGYCGTVLKSAYAANGSMPPSNPGDASYAPEYNALQAMCAAAPTAVPIPQWLSWALGFVVLSACIRRFGSRRQA